tara:strand:+ start:230 stop:586 length:357 start_codon:yes stop_codon:yes gene_type:complete
MIKNLSLEKIKEERKKSRLDKISSVIKKTVAEVFVNQNFNDEDGKSFFLCIDDVSMTSDCKVATVFIKSLNYESDLDKGKILDCIERNSVKIKKDFSKRMELRYTPKLKFRFLEKREK